MKGELIINSKDAYTEWGVSMGDKFLDSIDAPLSMKEYITNESRQEHGKRVITSNAKVDSRELTLSFTITGISQNDFRAKKIKFQSELEKGTVNIKVPVLGNDIYKLIYTGKNVSYNMNISRTFCKMSVKFEEPNPKNRE